MRRLLATVVIAVFFAGGSPAFAQFGAIKKAGEATADGAKKVGETTADGAKKVGETTEKGAKKVTKGTKDAVQTTYVCKDGKTDAAALKKDACREHGGVKAEQKAKGKY